MQLSKCSFGRFTLYTIEAGRFRLDGGAMFGVVPKTLWSRQIEADDKNRIPMAMRCLLIESHETGKKYLVDNGAGTKGDEKFNRIYGLDYSQYELNTSLEFHGFDAEDISDIIFTHLHFDHCGGTTFYRENGDLAHTFPNAAYHVTESHWKTAMDPNAREKASFLPDNIGPIGDSDRLNLINGAHTFEEGLSTIIVNGHTKGQQLPVIEEGETTLVFGGDLIPTHVHTPLPWVMGYDMYPVQTLEEKEKFLNKASDNNWYIFLEHDAEKEVIRIQKENGKYAVKDAVTLADMI